MKVERCEKCNVVEGQVQSSEFGNVVFYELLDLSCLVCEKIRIGDAHKANRVWLQTFGKFRIFQCEPSDCDCSD